MGSYTRTTRAWLENRFRKKDDNGNYFAHMPIYGIGHPSGEGNHVARMCRFLRILRVLDGLEFGTLLDVGGAEGYLSHVVRSVFGTDTATTDLSLEACQRARELFGLPAAAVDSSRLPFATDSFDVVVCSEVVEHLERPVETMLELCRIARRAVVLTTEEVGYNRDEIAAYLFKRPGWPHMERNLFHPDDFTNCLGNITMTPQTDQPPPDDSMVGDAALQWMEENTQSNEMAAGRLGVVATIPQAGFQTRQRRVDNADLLRQLLSTIIEPGHKATPPDADRQTAWLATMRDPMTGAALADNGDALTGSRSYPVKNGIPDFYVDEPDRTANDAISSDENDPLAALEEPKRTACMDLRKRLHLPDSWPQDLFDLRNPEQRRGFWPNEQLVPREQPGDGFCWHATSNDPWVVTPCLMRRVNHVELEMRVHSTKHGRDDLTGQIFWKDAHHDTFTEECSVKFPLINDGEVHRMKVDMTANSKLPSIIEWLRLDLADAPGEIDLLSIRLK